MRIKELYQQKGRDLDEELQSGVIMAMQYLPSEWYVYDFVVKNPTTKEEYRITNDQEKR